MNIPNEVHDRPIILGRYIVEHSATVRSCAKVFGVSKSTVHKDVTQNLMTLQPALYEDVKQVLNKNKSERHIRGGMATKLKYQKLKTVNNK